MKIQSPAPKQTDLTEPNYITDKKTSFVVSRPASSKDHPSKELQEILYKLGTLNERHEQLRDIVDQLRVNQLTYLK